MNFIVPSPRETEPYNNSKILNPERLKKIKGNRDTLASGDMLIIFEFPSLHLKFKRV